MTIIILKYFLGDKERDSEAETGTETFYLLDLYSTAFIDIAGPGLKLGAGMEIPTWLAGSALSECWC